MVESICEYQLYVRKHKSGVYLYNMTSQPTLMGKIIEKQQEDKISKELLEKMRYGEKLEGWTFQDSGLRY